MSNDFLLLTDIRSMEDDRALHEIVATDRILDEIGSGQLISSPDSVISLLIAWRRQEILHGTGFLYR